MSDRRRRRIVSGSIFGLDVGAPTVDGNGVATYSFDSIYNGPTANDVRVLAPTSPVAGQAHRYVYLLPVQIDDDFSDGDPIDIARVAGLHNTYNITFVMPQFHTTPWLADHPSTTHLKYETFMVSHLKRWVQTLPGGGEHWLVSFSKGGFSALSLLLRNPGVFDKAACWDFPDKATIYNGGAWQFDADDIFVTEANILAYDPATIAAARKAPFLQTNRIWISGDDSSHEVDTEQTRDALEAQLIVHTWEYGATRAHSWSSGWLPECLEVFAVPSFTAGLWHCDGANNSQVFLDSSGRGNDITAAGTAKVSTTGAKFNQCVVFDGSADNALDVNTHTDFIIIQRDFAIDFWVNPDDTAIRIWIDFVQNHGVDNMLLVFQNGADLIFYVNGAKITGTYTAGVLQHFALVRKNMVTRMFINGVQTGADYDDTNVYSCDASGPRFGCGLDGAFEFSGRMDEIRIIRGSDGGMFNGFTPPTAPY